MSLRRALDALEDLAEAENSGFPCNVHALYLEPPDNDDAMSGEDDADDDSGGIPDNVCAGQLKSGCELVFEDGRRINYEDELDDANGIEFSKIDDEELLANILNIPIVLVDDQPAEDPTDELSISTEEQPRKRLRRVQSTSSNVVLPEANKNTKFIWEKDNSSSFIPIFPDANYEDCNGLKAHEQFEKFFDDDLLQHICDCSAVYANFRNRPNQSFTVDGNCKILA